MLQKLWKCYNVMSSDEDQVVVEDVYVGFDTDMRLVVTIEHTDYEDSGNSCSVSAIVDKDDAFKLAKSLKASMMDLPDVISDTMEEYATIVNADFQQVQECFHEIMDWLIGKNCPYRIVRKYDKHGFVCC